MNDTTDLDSAVDALLSPEFKEPEENLDEAEDQEVAEVDDDQEEADEVEAEDEDDVESSDEDDDEVEVDQVESKAKDTKLFPVKVDGKEEMWTLEQLQQSAAGQAAINKRFQDAADLRKQVEAAAETVIQREKTMLELMERAKTGDLVAPIPPSKELFEKDPIGYFEAKMNYDEDKVNYDQKMAYADHVRSEHRSHLERQHQDFLHNQAEELARKIPEYGDPNKRQTFNKKMVEAGAAYGFGQDEMMQVVDSRLILALSDAAKYRDMQSNRKKVDQKAQTARPVIKAGVKKSQDGQAANRKKAETRLRRSGSIEDALALMLKS